MALYLFTILIASAIKKLIKFFSLEYLHDFFLMKFSYLKKNLIDIYQTYIMFLVTRSVI